MNRFWLDGHREHKKTLEQTHQKKLTLLQAMLRQADSAEEKNAVTNAIQEEHRSHQSLLNDITKNIH